MRSGKLLAVLALILTTTAVVYSQISPDLEQGMKPYGSFHGGDLDHISMSNGNLFFHAGLTSYSQRGSSLAYPIMLQYNSENFNLFYQPCPQGVLPGNQGCPIHLLFGPPIDTQ